MSEALPDRVPWGRPAVDAIPLPPFATDQEAARYRRLLQLHLALIDDGGPSAALTALLETLDAGSGWRVEAGRDLSGAELRLSLATYFPAPWTPERLAPLLAEHVTWGAPVKGGASWRWLGDPDFGAIPDSGGGWRITRHERGSLAHDTIGHDDLVLLWMEHFCSRFPYPFGHRVSDEDLDALASAAAAVRAAHADNVAAPYLVGWRAERDAALAAGSSSHDD
ncbi:hypothetical protein ACFC1I_19215 [Microbacterium sp. NPDC056044]|uniref:hypothetical protein n=1 Tax=Microbacterium sp. NPDC056044 TaxID=3345690 RepID=UPI0035E1F358